jgi:hypothetical protein
MPNLQLIWLLSWTLCFFCLAKRVVGMKPKKLWVTPTVSLPNCRDTIRIRLVTSFTSKSKSSPTILNSTPHSLRKSQLLVNPYVCGCALWTNTLRSRKLLVPKNLLLLQQRKNLLSLRLISRRSRLLFKLSATKLQPFRTTTKHLSRLSKT